MSCKESKCQVIIDTKTNWRFQSLHNFHLLNISHIIYNFVFFYVFNDDLNSSGVFGIFSGNVFLGTRPTTLKVPSPYGLSLDTQPCNLLFLDDLNDLAVCIWWTVRLLATSMLT